jgi:integral membrane sensor domain MASE1
MQRTRWILVTVLVLVGAIWVGQGTGLLRGSSPMVDEPLWAIAGTVLVVAAALVAIDGVRRRRA